MARYLLAYCPYDPENYRGHRFHNLEAQDFTAAKAEARKFLDDYWVGTNWEFRLIELGPQTSDYRLWDTRDKPNQRERDYTTSTFWEADQ